MAPAASEAEQKVIGNKLGEAFRNVDKDQVGEVPESELPDLLKSVFPDVPDHILEVYRSLVLRFNAEGVGEDAQAGVVDYGRWVTPVPATQSLQQFLSYATRILAVNENFTDLDGDHTGFLEAAELNRLYTRALPDISPADRESATRAIITECDQNGNGRIERQEMLKACLRRFDEGDAGQSTRLQRRQVRYKPTGVKGGVNGRCPALSPRRNSAQLLTDGLLLGVARVTELAPPVERLEMNDFVPQGITGEELYKRAEQEIERDASGHPWNEAQEAFGDSARAFCHEGDWEKAGDAYLRAADCQTKMMKVMESSNSIVKASECFEKSNPEKAVGALSEAIDSYENDDRRQPLVARLYKRGAEVFEKTLDFDNSIDWFEQAAEIYAYANDQVSQAKCLRRVAELHARSREWDVAIKTYEKVAALTLADKLKPHPSLSQVEVRDDYFRAVLCHLAKAGVAVKGIDRLEQLENSEKAFNKYTDSDLENFNTGLEYFLVKAILPMEFKQDLSGMTTAIGEYIEARAPPTWLQDLLNLLLQDLQDWIAHINEQAKKALEAQLIL